MSHAERLAILVAAAAAVGCCPIRWPETQRLAPAQAYVRYVAQAVKEGDKRCAAATDKKEELEACIAVYGDLKTVLVRLETP